MKTAVEKGAMTEFAAGDVIEVATGAGPRYVQITHRRPPYADVVRAIDATAGVSSAEEAAKHGTAFTAIVETRRILTREVEGRRLGNAPIPKKDQDYPTFRLAVRDKAGEALYWWKWDGEGLSIGPPIDDSGLPVREIISVQRLAERLANEVG